eukprot:Gregarina_sp_Poly_1__3849@NODE_2149_length_2598_cov_16_449230_g1384_i0_p1_GENE_NODE_2149_length_2598_cov_16_449230_g1384_i0NODE_2149_length_2598_cov_16_449230_g1384_i0_p1_ORF_typecomplete_len166_score9_05_NODE_2149_length_2598_cov_16_449230_g1384_i09791476
MGPTMADADASRSFNTLTTAARFLSGWESNSPPLRRLDKTDRDSLITHLEHAYTDSLHFRGSNFYLGAETISQPLFGSCGFIPCAHPHSAHLSLPSCQSSADFSTLKSAPSSLHSNAASAHKPTTIIVGFAGVCAQTQLCCSFQIQLDVCSSSFNLRHQSRLQRF